MNQMATIGHNLRDPVDVEIEVAIKEFRSQLDDRKPDIEGCVVSNEDEAGRATALAGIIADIIAIAEKRRVELKDPFLQGGRKVDTAFKALDELLKAAKAGVVKKIDAYAAEQERIAEEAAAKAAKEAAEKEAAARAAAESGNLVQAAILEQQAERAANTAEQATMTVSQPIRSAFGQSASRTTVWLFEIEDHKKLPKSITQHPKVVAAIESVIGGLVRSGARDIKGVRIYSDKETRVRR